MSSCGEAVAEWYRLVALGVCFEAAAQGRAGGPEALGKCGWERRLNCLGKEQRFVSMGWDITAVQTATCLRVKEGCVSYTRKPRDKLGLPTHYHFLAVCAWASYINLPESCFLHKKGKDTVMHLFPGWRRMGGCELCSGQSSE